MGLMKGARGTALVRSSIVVALAVAASLALAAPAGATITKTQITTPAKSPSYFTYNANHQLNAFTVAGTTNSTTPSKDKVDILCFYDTTYRTIVSGVPLNRNGSFSVNAPLGGATEHECQLAALPSGDVTLEPAYTGPRIEVSERRTSFIFGGLNYGRLFDWYAWGQQTALADDYFSIGSCGLCDSYLLDSTGAVTSIVFYVNAELSSGNENGQGDTRSEIEVDGQNAYVPYAAESLFGGSENLPGFPSLSWTFSQNPKTGDVTITDTEEIARCSGSPPYPPTATTCTRFKSTGVEVVRKIVQNASGHMVWITDNFASTDGHAHKLDLLYDNGECLSANTCDPSSTGFRFPGESTYTAHAPGDIVHVPTGIGSIYVKVIGAPDGDPATGQGAITYGQAPTEILFINPCCGNSEFTMHYKGKVPATRSLTYRFVYSTAYTHAQVHTEALAAQRALKTGRPVALPAGPAPPRLPAGSVDMPAPAAQHAGKK